MSAIYDQLGWTERGDFVLRGTDGSRRTIVVPNTGTFDPGGPDRILALERSIHDAFVGAVRDDRPSSRVLSGVYADPGTSTDFTVVNRNSMTRKALLHVMARPDLIDARFLARLSAGETVPTLLLLSDSGCFEVTKADTDGSPIALVKVVDGDDADFYGRVADYLREEFGEGIKSKPIALNTARPKSESRHSE